LPGCAPAAEEAAPDAQPSDRAARLRAMLADEDARALLADAYRQQQWPHNAAHWRGNTLLYRQGVRPEQRLDFDRVHLVRLRRAYDDFGRDFQLVIAGASGKQDDAVLTELILEADRFRDAAALARAASRLAGVDITRQDELPPLDYNTKGG